MARKKAEKTRDSGGGADLFRAYLARNPERDPRILLPRSALPLARGAFLFKGVVVDGWSLGWLIAFLFAEFVLVVRLAVLGDRFSTGPKADPEIHRRTSLTYQLAWLVVSIAGALFAGQALDRSTRGAWFGLSEAGGLWELPSWGVVAYVVLLIADFVIEGVAARRERRMFVPAGVLQAALFLVGVILTSFVAIFLAGIADEIFGESGGRAVFALALILSRAGSELAVLWLPIWFPWAEARGKRRKAAEAA
jgi:hypothetical protein